MLSKEAGQLCHLFADVLDYPNSSLCGVAGNCAQQLERSLPGVTGPMRAFAAFVGSQRLEALEELYTQTFDMTPANTLYLSYHLFGETPKRSIFLIRLQEAYRAHSFSSGMELADHLGVILRFLSIAKDPEFTLPLLEECLLPVLYRMEDELRKNENVYAQVISPLRMFLQHISRKSVKTGGVPNA